MSTKIHALDEGLGNLARWTLTAGQTHDATETAALLDGVVTEAVIADKAYDADELILRLEQAGATAVIPPRSNRR